MAVVILEGKKDDINEEVIFARDSDDYPMYPKGQAFNWTWDRHLSIIILLNFSKRRGLKLLFALAKGTVLSQICSTRKWNNPHIIIFILYIL